MLEYSPLIHAAADGNVEVVKLLLKNGADVNAQDEVHFNSALHEASWKGYSQTIEALCKYKANPYLKNKQGHSALHLACQQGHNQSCRILLLNGCKPDIKNNFGDSPLHSAARYGHAGVVRILISAYCNVNEVNKNGDTGLHISAAMGRKKLTRILLEAGCNPTITNKQGETAMDIALRKCHNEVQEIIANPPPIKKPDEYQSKQTKTTTKREKENSQGSKDSQGKSRSDLKHKKSKSTGSTRSVHFSGDEHHLHHHHHGHNKTKEVPTYWSPYGCHLHPDSTDFPKPKLDSLPSDPLNKGEQYYIDLAGNIRKGPVGLSTRCYCAPVLKKVEKKMEKDKQEIIDHIDSTHDNLNEKICNLEKKTQNQLVTLNETVKERLAHEREECTERVQRCALKERIELERRQRLQVEQLKGEVKSWLTNKFENHRRSCQDNIHQQQHHQQQQKFQNQNHQHHHHQQLHNHLYQHENLQQNYSTKPNQMTHQTHERPQSSQDGPLVICGWHKTSIPRSKSEIFLNASGENSEEEPMGQLQGSAVHQMKIEKNSVPNSNSVLDKDILSDTKNKQHQGLLVVADFEKLGARPKDQIKTNEVIQNGITMGINSGSLLEINNHSNKCENMKTSDIKTTSDINVIHDRDSNRIINDHNQTDLMKSLRCNGTVLTRGEQGDSPFNDSGYHTKFSPSPRDPITTTQNHQTTYAIISKCSPPIKSSLNQHQHNQTSIQYTSAVFEPPIGLPPPVFKSQIFKHRFPVPVIVHSNNKQFNGPNSSLV